MSETDQRRPSRVQRPRHKNGVKPGYEELVRAAEASVGTYTPAEAIDMVGETGVLFIDVRDAVELSDGMVSGAIHASRGRLEAHLDPDNPRYVCELDDAAEIIFYCASGARSALAAQRAQELGYDRVRYLDGGIAAWTDAGGQRQAIDN
ncbi:rhodanese-like domain-containing protein [Natronosalvus vescus]|uniref:rhodanese-like domain-containing protein n=1 Tax=Natronosalvus vescus TaxID=2953881 RepID=UPI002091075A|nr:rhodanese-like domain-containing protein [Natronosalvus vescus]